MVDFEVIIAISATSLSLDIGFYSVLHSQAQRIGNSFIQTVLSELNEFENQTIDAIQLFDWLTRYTVGSLYYQIPKLIYTFSIIGICGMYFQLFTQNSEIITTSQKFVNNTSSPLSIYNISLAFISISIFLVLLMFLRLVIMDD